MPLLAIFVASSAWGQLALGPAAAAAAVSHAPPPYPPTAWKLVESDHEHKLWETTFVSAFTSPSQTNNLVPLWVSVPASGTGPFKTVILLHYLGASNLSAVSSIARRLNQRGIAAAYLVLPYHMERTPPGHKSGELAITANVQSLNAMAVQSVWDVRRAADIISHRSDLTLKDLGIGGVSLGSLIAELSYGVDDRFQSAAFILGGTQLAGILWNSAAVIPVKTKLQRLGITEDGLKFFLAGVEPGAWIKARAQSQARQNPALLITAKYDQIMPGFASSSLAKALPQASRIYLDTGHYGGFFAQGKIEDQAADFFSAIDQGLAYSPPSSIKAPTLRLMAQAMTSLGFDIGVGLDLFRTPGTRPYFGTLAASPRGLEIFAGKEIIGGAAIGGVISTRGAGIGVFWSVIL